MATPATPMPQATKAKPLSALALKVQKQQEAAAAGQSGYGTIPASLGQGRDGVFLLFDPLAFVNGIGRSDSGKTEGCNLVVSDEFTVEIEGIGAVTYMVEGRLPLKAKVKLAGLAPFGGA
ncbi:MAG: hypothetical protein KGI27_09770 [Thaumarchaeota archaeon]|nr:hypothetical protein [Nitrososphaerota archaeon]